MNSDLKLYPNIVNFLESNNFLIKSLEPEKIEIIFPGDEIAKTYKKFFEIREKAAIETNHELSDKLYNKSWDILIKTEKKYYPKINPILELLNNFYKDHHTPLEFMLILENDDIRKLSLGANPLFYAMYPDKKFFSENTINELEKLDNFIMNN